MRGKNQHKSIPGASSDYSVPGPRHGLRTHQSGTTVFQGVNGNGDSASVAQRGRDGVL